MLSDLLWGEFLLSNYWPSAMGCILCYFLFYFINQRNIFGKKNILKHPFVTWLGLKGESIADRGNFKWIVAKSGPTLNISLRCERARFSRLPSCLPFKRTIFLCLKAPAVENAQVSRPTYQRTRRGMSPLGCHLFETFTEGAVPEMRKRDTWHRREQNTFKGKLIYSWNQTTYVWRPLFGTVLLPRTACE